MTARVDAIVAEADPRDEAKAYLRVETPDEDALIARLVGAAIGHAEGFTGQLLPARGVVETVPATTGWRRLARSPVKAIATVESVGADGTAAALPVGAYAIDIDANGDGWVRSTSALAAGRLRVSYTAGLADAWGGLPEALRQGVLRLVAHLYAQRDAADEGEPPAAVAALWRPWRRMRLT